MLSVIDIGIIFIILFGGLIGMKRGVIKQGVMTIGLSAVLIFSFLLKNPISAAMYRTLPFFGFDKIIENSTVLNVLVYEVIAFLIAFSILEIILTLLIKLSSIVEKILDVTVILALPSKILGFILGAAEYYLLVFIILFILSQPTFGLNNTEIMRTSKLKPIILSKTIVISSMSNNTINTYNKINKLIKNKDNMNYKDFNCNSLRIMIENKFLDEKSAKYLYDSGKINTKCGIGD